MNHSVGLSAVNGIGDEVNNNVPIMLVHANTQDDVEQAISNIHKAITYSENIVEQSSVVIERISSDNK